MFLLRNLYIYIIFDTLLSNNKAEMNKTCTECRLRPSEAGLGRVVQGKAMHDLPYSNFASRDLNLGKEVEPYGWCCALNIKHI